MFVYSVYQSVDHQKVNSTYSINCAQEPYFDYLPLSITLKEPTGDINIKCAWPSINSSARIMVSLVSSIYFLLMIYYVCHQRRKLFLWLVVPSSLIYYLSSLVSL